MPCFSIVSEKVPGKNLEATLLFVDFSEAFDSLQRGKIEQIFLTYSLLKETVTAKTMLYKNTKTTIRTSDGDTDVFDNVTRVLEGDKIAPYVFIICLYYVQQTSTDQVKKNGLTLRKERSRWYLSETIPDAVYTDDQVFLWNTPTEAEFILHSLEQAARGICLYGNFDKTEFICLKQDSTIFVLNEMPLKLVDQYTYFSCNISTKSDVSLCIWKAWIDRLSIIWKSNLSDKIR